MRLGDAGRAILMLLAALCVCAFTRGALGQTSCTDPRDCDGDGLDNIEDGCPTGFSGAQATLQRQMPGGSTARTPKRTAMGFRDIRCYDAFLPEVHGACVPIKARFIAEDVPNDALDPTKGITRRAGFVWVGTYKGETASEGPFGLEIAPADVVRDSFDRVGVSPFFGDLPMNTLFACMGAVEFDATNAANRGAVTSTLPALYGFELVANYVRAVREAAMRAADPDNFSDAIGLIREVRVKGANPKWLPGLVGHSGTFHDNSVFGWDSRLIQDPDPKTLPRRVDRAWDGADCGEQKIADHIKEQKGPLFLSAKASVAEVFQRIRTPFGLPPMGEPTSAGPLTSRFGQEEYLARSVILRPPLVGTYEDCYFPLAEPALVFVQPSFEIRVPRKPEVFGSRKNLGRLLGWNQFFQAYAPPKVTWAGVDRLATLAGGDAHLTFSARSYGSLLEPRPSVPPPGAAASSTYAGGSKVEYMPFLGWGLIKGPAFRALQAMNAETRPIVIYTAAKSAASETISIHLVEDIQKQSYNWSKGIWQQNWISSAGSLDYVEATIPAAETDSTQYDFKLPNQTFFSAHYRPDTWNPGVGDWWTNAPGTACSLSAERPQIAAHASNVVGKEWCHDAGVPKDLDKTKREALQFYGEREEYCDDIYDPGSPDAHWPLLRERVPFSGLFGSSNTATAALAGDLTKAGILTVDASILHFGVDINWQFGNENMIDPRFRGVLGEAPAYYCYGEHVLVPDLLQFPYPCSDDNMKLCWEEATGDGCNQHELANAVFESRRAECQSPDCPEVDCGPLITWACNIVTCAPAAFESFVECAWAYASGAVQWAWRHVEGYAGGLCAAFSGNPCLGADSWRLHARPYPGRKIEHELEYTTGFGGNTPSARTTPSDDCYDFYFKPNCEASDFIESQLANRYYAGCSSNKKGPFGSKHCSERIEVNDKLESIVNGKLGDIWPYSFAPGIFNSREGVWGWTMRKFGEAGPFPQTSPEFDAVRVLPETSPRRFDTDNSGFRMRFLGDLIIDCGHHPLRTEIHPPVAVMLDASFPEMAHKRYSLFGWHRDKGDDSGDEIDPEVSFDLWPGPRFFASQRLSLTDLFPESQGIVTTAATRKGKIACQEFPPLNPNRFRCRYIADDANSNRGEDTDNPRMAPDYATDAAGGLVELSWQ